ncbi:MAG: hypothetical protein HUJ74_03650 [Lachnospiraceae bacterium]|nr:hypothetical protein [Lachnospiraceae bacterium]
MDKKIKKLFVVAASITGTWALAIKPRISNKPDMSEMKRYDFANRGYYNIRKKIPENSLVAFNVAVEHGYGIVMDVRMSRDGVPVIFRDHQMCRMCGIDGTVEESDWEKLKECCLSRTQETIPCLSDGLKLVDGKVPVLLNLNVDLDNYGLLCARVCEVLDAYKGVFAIESSDYRVVKWLKNNRPKIIRGQMIERHIKHRGIDMTQIHDVVRYNLLTNFLTSPDFISCNIADRTMFSLMLCRLLYKVQMINWTVNNMHDYELVKTDDSIVIFEDIEP